MKDPETPEHPEERRARGESTTAPAPFDTSDLHQIPDTTVDDPPYRNWWVMTDPGKR